MSCVAKDPARLTTENSIDRAKTKNRILPPILMKRAYAAYVRAQINRPPCQRMNANWLKYLPRLVRDHLEGRHHLQQAIGNSGWLLLDKILRMAASLVIGIWMARVLGPVQFGQFNYALAFVALFAPIATLGLDGIVVRNLVMERESPQATLGSVAVLRLLGALAAVILCNATVMWFKPDDSLAHLLVLIISLGLIFQSTDVVDCWFQSRVTSRYIVLAKLPALLGFFGVRILLLLGAFSLYMFAWAQILELLMGAFGVLAAYRICGNSFRQWHPDFNHALALLREAWPQALAGLSVMLYMKIDVVMLQSMAGDRATGIYSAATRLSEGIYFIPMIVVSSLAPMLVRSREIGRDHYFQTLSKLYVTMVRLSLTITVIILAVSPWLVEALYGTAYTESVAVLQIHIWASIPVFLGVASSQYLTNEGYQTLSLYRTLVGLIVNVALNLALIPQHGAMGAAIATLISYSIATFSILLSPFARSQCHLMLRAMQPRVIFGLSRPKV